MCIAKIKKCIFGKASSCYQEQVEVVWRVLLGLFILPHGWGKLSSFSEKSAVFPDPLGIGSFMSLALATWAEFFCAILLIFGLFTRFAAFNLLATMLVAGLIFHAADPFSKKELALLYAIGFLYFTLVGGSSYSLDHIIRKKWLKTS